MKYNVTSAEASKLLKKIMDEKNIALNKAVLLTHPLRKILNLFVQITTMKKQKNI